jgi:hypothetical protein
MSPLRLFVRRMKKSATWVFRQRREPLFARVLGLTIGVGIAKAFAVLVLGMS